MAEETKQQEAEQPEKTYSAAEYTALQEQLDAARTSLKETAEKLSSFEKMDIDGIKASVEEYKQKLTQAEAELSISRIHSPALISIQYQSFVHRWKRHRGFLHWILLPMGEPCRKKVAHPLSSQ